MSKSKPVMSHAKMVKLGKIRRKSKIKSPVAFCWELYSRNPKLQRKDAMNLAMAQGIAFNTARSQYQAWRTAGKANQAAAERSAALMASVGLAPRK